MFYEASRVKPLKNRWLASPSFYNGRLRGDRGKALNGQGKIIEVGDRFQIAGLS